MAKHIQASVYGPRVPVCACGSRISDLRAFFGKDLEGHLSTCDECGGELHVDEGYSCCLDCGRTSGVDAEGSTYVGNFVTGEMRCTHNVALEREIALGGGFYLVVEFPPEPPSKMARDRET